ncbi:hypothetical protein [Luteolibacter marinus]|uniref:hypothetical protein n=1 Tax=Luteolibacter marinus TaxID=2776705 RepID=UPI0018678AB3|nr:hypothetical protein [Luteolibacter marinus]
MESPEEIEKALSRLMPSAISEKGQRSLDELIDSLAAGEEQVAEMPRKSRLPWWGGVGAAAAAVVVALSLPTGNQAAVDHSQVQVERTGNSNGGILLLGQSKRVEAAEPQDWMSESDGVAYRAWRVRVVDEERVQDLETGYEVLVSCPRDEVRLLPVTAF